MTLGTEGFRWFIGIVEDVKSDPLKLGRARVRVYLLHDGVPTEQLHWAHCMLPTTSGSYKGIGDTPNLVEGSQVVGFFMDGQEEQRAMILGSFPIIPGMKDDDHSISYLARGKAVLNQDKIGVEPDSAYAAEYPFNRVIRTRSGHAIELDDTPENERINIHHKSGTYIEINAEGRLVIKSVADSYNLTGKDKSIEVKGTVHMRVEGDVNSIVKGNMTAATEGNVTISSKGVLSLMGAKGVRISSGKEVLINAPGGMVIPQGSLSVMGAIASGVGATGFFSTVTGKTVHVAKGIVSTIV